MGRLRGALNNKMKSIIRSFLKRKFSSTIIIISLFVAFVSTFLIAGFVINEYSVDSYHSKKENIYRLLSDDPWEEGHTFPHITKAAPEFIKNSFPEVVDYVQWNKNGYEKLEANNTTFFKDFKIYETGASFFDIFSFKLIEGEQSAVFLDRNNIVLSEETALRIFGSSNVLGEPITIKHRNETKNYLVSGVVETPKNRSHLYFDMLTSIEGKEFRGCNAYLLLRENTSAADFEKKLQNHKAEIPFFRNDTNVNYYLENLMSIYMSKELKTKITIFVIIAVLILFVAFFNYFNLISTQIFERENEVKIKRIIGGSYANIVRSLAAEFSILILGSTLLGFLGIKLFLPVFNAINQSALVFADFMQPKVLGYIFLVVIFVFILSYLATFLYVKKQSRSGASKLKKATSFPVVSTFQFAVSTVLIICTLFIIKQIKYVHSKDIGLNRDIVEMRLPPLNNDKSLVLKELLLENPSIDKVSICSASPVREGAMVLYSFEENGEKKEYSPLYFSGDHEYINTLGISLLDGQDFYPSATQNSKKCLVNQAMIQYLNLKDPIGKTLPGSKNEIVGIVSDFHWNSLENKIPPSMIAYSNSGSNVLVKINPELYQAGLKHVQESWNKTIPDFPFDYWTIGDWFNKKHAKYDLMVRFITFFCFIAIFLSIIGLIARSIITINYKRKEIGIRKVNGARISEVLFMLNKKFMVWVAIAYFTAVPIAWFAMNKWLENFAYKTKLSWWIFALSGLLALGIALLTVSWQSWKAASRNPVEALRYE